MNRGKPGETAFTVLVFLGLAGAVYSASLYSPGARTMPILFGGLGLVLVGIVLIGNYVPTLRKWTDAKSVMDELIPIDEGGDDGEGVETLGGLIRMFAYVIGLFLMLFFTGLVVTVPTFLTAYLAAEAKVRLHWAIVTAIVSTALMVMCFHLMYIDLWTGVMLEIVPDYVGGAIWPEF